MPFYFFTQLHHFMLSRNILICQSFIEIVVNMMCVFGHRRKIPAFESKFNSKRQMGYKAHQAMFTEMKEECGMDFRAGTHAGRGSGARALHDAGYGPSLMLSHVYMHAYRDMPLVNSSLLAHLDTDNSLCVRVDLDDIKMQGKWNHEHVVGSYVCGVPLLPCLAAAGMPVLNGRVYILVRNRVNRAEYTDLHATVFPGLKDQLERIKAVMPMVQVQCL